MRCLLLLLLAFLLICWAAHADGLRLNTTASMPIGLYRITDAKPQKGECVTFCLDQSIYTPLSAERSYLGHSSLCSSGLDPLLKILAGVPGDLVAITPQGIRVNNRLQPNSKILPKDSQGRLLPVFLTSGVIPEGKALVLAGYDTHSFDSRYFGLVNLDSLQLVVPIFTFDPRS